MLTGYQRWWLKRFLRRIWLDGVRHPIEFLAVFVTASAARVSGIDGASAIGAWIGRTLGYRSGRSRIARRNLARAFPDRNEAEIERITRACWENAGRSAMEYTCLDQLRLDGPDPRVELVGAEHITALRDDGRPGLLFSAHLGNWEMVTLAIRSCGIEPLHLVYRSANNPYLAVLIKWLRRRAEAILIPKGAAGAREIMKVMKDGGHVVMLVDQKMNDGIAVPFFGRDAMTAPALAQLALRFDAPVVPVRVERLGRPAAWPDETALPRDGDRVWGPRYRVTAYPPLDLTPPPATSRAEATRLGTLKVNQVLEDWVRERPEQWLWFHRRWPD